MEERHSGGYPPTILYDFSYSESVEIHRIDEAAATPFEEGAHLSECFSNNKRI